jgi:hypothetical protein
VDSYVSQLRDQVKKALEARIRDGQLRIPFSESEVDLSAALESTWWSKGDFAILSSKIPEMRKMRDFVGVAGSQRYWVYPVEEFRDLVFGKLKIPLPKNGKES